MKTKCTPRKSRLKLIKNDPWLEPFAAAIEGRHEDAIRKEAELTSAAGSLEEFANAHNYFGLHRLEDGGWVFREWAPNATGIYLIGDFNGFIPSKKYALKRLKKSNGENSEGNFSGQGSNRPNASISLRPKGIYW